MIDYQTYLKERSIPFEVKNNGQHLIVEGPHNFIDFWPGTGRWVCRETKKNGFGARQLIAFIQGA